MPTYEYKCDEGHEFEASQSIKDDAYITCIMPVSEGEYSFYCSASECGAPCRRLISNTSFKFKGGSPTPKYHH